MVGRLDERELRLREGGGVERIKADDCDEAFVSLAASYSLCGDTGCRGRWSSSKPKARWGRIGRLKGGKGRRELEGKGGGGERAFIPLAEHRAGRLNVSGTIPATAGGEGGSHGVAKPDGVIHRYSLLPRDMSEMAETQNPRRSILMSRAPLPPAGR